MGGASGPMENRSSLYAAPKLCSERGRVVESERVSPTTPLRYLEDRLSFKMKLLERRARASVVPDTAEEVGVSQSEIRWFRKGEGTGLIGRLLGLIDIEFGLFFWVDVDGCSWKRIETNWFGCTKLEALTKRLKSSYPGNFPKCEGFVEAIN